jgi:hypothetical protein
MQSVTDDLQSRALPLLEDGKKLTTEVQSILEAIRPKLNVILDNAAIVSTTARNQTQKIDVALTGFMDHARIHAIRVDDLLNRTFDRVEDTSAKVQSTVLSPIKHLNGVLQGLGVGLETLFQKARQPKNGRHNDEMFI